MEDNNLWLRVIKPRTGWFDLDLKQLLHKKDLIALFVLREFGAKYKQTILGPAWAVVQPFLTTVVFSLIFGKIANLSSNEVPDFIFYLAGTIIWTFFANCFTFTANTFITNREILSKVYFPRLVMPISTVISQLISFGIQFCFMVLFLVYYLITEAGVNPNLYILMTPVLILQMAMLGLGFGIIVSSLTTKYRDLAMLITFCVQLWQFVSPVAYDISIIPARLMNVYLLNPVTPIILVFKYAYLGISSIQWQYYWISWGTTIVILLLGLIMFSKVEKSFMDNI